MRGAVEDTQKNSFRKLIQEVIPNTISDASCDISEDYRIDFKPLESSNTVPIQDKDGTVYYPIKALGLLKDKVTGESVEFNVTLLNVPQLQELGFKIKGNYMQRLDQYERAKGWSFSVDKHSDYAKVLAKNNRSISFVAEHGKEPYMQFLLRGDKKKKIKVSTFLRVISGFSNQELVSMFGFNNPQVISIFGVQGDNRDVHSCIRSVTEAIFDDVDKNERTSLVMRKDIMDNIFSERYFPMGHGNAERLNYMQSFSYRANGRTLAETIKCGDTVFGAGLVLSTRELAVLDMMPIRSLKVEYKGKLYTLHKFSTFTFDALGCRIAEDVPDLGLIKGQILEACDIRSLNASNLTEITIDDGVTLVRRTDARVLSVDDFFTAFSIWVDNLNGYDLHEKPYEVTNRILISYDKEIEDYIRTALNTVIINISGNLKVADMRGTLSMAVNHCFDGIDPNAFIASVTNPKANSGQISDMCNVLAYVSKSNKATSQVPAAATTQDLLNVQDLQEGRLDPLDVPESDKIGRVHYRTMFAKLDDDGNAMAPYLRVENGKVVSDEPVYLTAMQEADQYIAEWNETFVDDDGNKKQRVRTRCNGLVQSIETDRVTFKEFSPYQNLSPAHSMIPFPGHSNGKRITMGCNQEKQAVPTVSLERPYTCAGGESLLDIGTYSVKDVLKEFYATNKHLIKESEETVMSSNIRLVDITSGDGERVLHLEIMAVDDSNNKYDVTIPYLFRNYESAMFSYCINPKPDNVYGPDDVLAYNNGYSLEKKDVVMCADFGAQKVDPKVFDKGVALTKNLVVVYKTYDGSVIEDGILISDRLVYDDKLTHIGLFEIKDSLSTGGDFDEQYSIQLATAPDYLEASGLPAVGTILKPGMPAIGKVRTVGNKVTSRYVYTPTYVEGQVIRATIRETQKGLEAVVIVAQRSYANTGDKMAGRCGNKGVIARIVPESEMPYAPNLGVTADVVLNPLGIPSRQNISQLLDAALSMCMKMEDKIAVVSPYNANDVDFVRAEAEKHNLHPEVMIDGRTGQPYSRPLNVGVLPMYKLHHVAKRKIHAVGMDAKIDTTFLQPMKGSKQNGGQSFGEMETWCLESVGATALLNELFTVQSDDVVAQKELIEAQNQGLDYTKHGINCNDFAMQACYMSLGVKFGVEGTDYVFKPLTDYDIHAFSPWPITNESQLHSANIFGSADSKEAKAAGRSRWGWIDLGVPMVMPLWVKKGYLSKLTGQSLNHFEDVIAGKAYFCCAHASSSVGYCTEQEFADMTDDEREGFCTGVAGVINVLQNLDTETRELSIKATMEELVASRGEAAYKSNKYNTLLSQYTILKDFNASGITLKDYIITAFPVMPQTYRPLVKIAGRSSVPDFDWHYTQIINASNAAKENQNMETMKALYDAILAFTGLQSTGSKQNSKDKYQNLLNFFSGKGKKSHGRIRQNMQSKRIMCSARCAIKPAEDITRSPLMLGVPFTVLVKIFEEPLYGFARNLAVGKLNHKRFSKMMMDLARRDEDAFNKMYHKYFTAVFPAEMSGDPYGVFTKLVKDFLEGTNGNTTRVVCSGRQPSLHKYSVRAFIPYVVYDQLIHLNPLLCKGFNADFDGDQMYLFAAQTEETAEEALEKLSPAKDILLPKNGSIVLEHSQDIVLGVYCATMLRDNADAFNGSVADVRYYNSPEEIRVDYKNGDVEAWDLCSLVYKGRHYLSTAGRIMFNSLIPGAFTMEPFTNPLQLDGIKPELYNELKYDGIVCSGKSGKVSNLNYYSLPDICKDVYNELDSECIDVYQAISEFGFRVSDKTGVSLSLEDFDIETSKDETLANTEKIKNQIEQDYQDGLISEKDKREAVISIYSDTQDGANTLILNDLLNNLDRNNNIFIMMDSGARGNKSQLMHMCGAVGILQKTKTEDLETSVTSNYYQGLGSFDVHLASYSARTGVASTQNETKSSGYASHQVVYLASGLQVVERDCGKDDWNFEIEWDEHKGSLDRFEPNREWFNTHLLGKELAADASDKERHLTTNGKFTEDSFERLKMITGFHELHLQDGTLCADVYDAVDQRVIDEESRHLLKHLTADNVLNVDAIDSLLKNKVEHVVTDAGTYHLRYSMTASCRSLLCNRIARNVPYLSRVLNRSTGEKVDVISDRTLDWIEEYKIDEIDARTTLNCKSKYGICAHCFGLKFSNEQLPEIGEFVGTESAQSIAEPASQLTMNVINKGGVAGSSNVSSGVDVFKDLLAGGKPNSLMSGIVAMNSGYVHLEKLDADAAVSIKPEDPTSDICYACMSNSKMLVCPMSNGADKICYCKIQQKIPFNSICVKEGEWVNAGDPITKDMVHPDTIVAIAKNSTPERVHTRKQRVWINNYFNTFKDSGISVRARHFELIAYVQNKYVRVVASNDPSIQVGKVYEFNEVDGKDVVYDQMVCKRDEAILWNSGALAALSFENVAEVAANLVTGSYKSSTLHNHSLISSLAIGEDLKTREIKQLNEGHGVFVYSAKNDNNGVPDDAIIITEQESSNVEPIINFDFDALLSDVEDTIPAVETEVVPEEVATDNLSSISAFGNVNTDESDSSVNDEQPRVALTDFATDEDEFVLEEDTGKQDSIETRDYKDLKEDNDSNVAKITAF